MVSVGFYHLYCSIFSGSLELNLTVVQMWFTVLGILDLQWLSFAGTVILLALLFKAIAPVYLKNCTRLYIRLKGDGNVIYGLHLWTAFLCH